VSLFGQDFSISIYWWTGIDFVDIEVTVG